MELNEFGGYRLSGSSEVNAALRVTRTSGNNDLAESILKRAIWVDGVDFEKERLTRRADLGPDESQALMNELEKAARGEIELHPSYMEAIENMLDQHVVLQITCGSRKPFKALGRLARLIPAES